MESIEKTNDCFRFRYVAIDLGLMNVVTQSVCKKNIYDVSKKRLSICTEFIVILDQFSHSSI